MYCTNCGKKISESNKYCVHCGTPVKGAASNSRSFKPETNRRVQLHYSISVIAG